MVKKYVKKPVVIEAVKFTKDSFEEVKKFTNNTAHSLETDENGVIICTIPTLEGEMIASEHDYIIKGINGEFYPCKPDIFEKTYDSYQGVDFDIEYDEHN